MVSSKEIVVNELHKPARRNFQRRRVIVKGLNDLFQADLVEMLPYAKVNKNFNYILTVIDCFSKYAWAIPVKHKSAKYVADAMYIVLKERAPKNLQTDNGTEFYNKNFKALMKEYGINHYSVYSTKKACIVERFNRTLKGLMYKYFSLHGSYKWLDALPNLINHYNNKYHRTIKMKPSKVTEKNAASVLAQSFNHIKMVGTRKFHVGDHVRISKFRNVFSRGFHPQWTTEIFTVREVKLTNPVVYLLKDYQDHNIDGAFYEQELQKVKDPSVFLVEKVIRQKGSKVLVKWLGFGQEHNSWVNKKDIL